MKSEGKVGEAEYARRRFLNRFVHPLHDDPEQAVPNAFRRLIFSGSPCGWWWCGATLNRRRWENLLDAVAVLEKQNLDPKGLDILTIVSEVRASEQLGPARDLLNRFDKAARDLLAGLWPHGPTEVLKKSASVEAIVNGQRHHAIVEVREDPFTLLNAAIKGFEPLVRVANATRPADQDPRVKNGYRAAVTKGRELSRAGDRLLGRKPRRWTTEAVAAALILTGVDEDQLHSLTARLAKMGMKSRQPRQRSHRTQVRHAG